MNLYSKRGIKKSFIKTIINSAFSKLGYSIHKLNKPAVPQNYSKDFLELISKNDYMPYTMLSLENLYALFNSVRHVTLNHIEGDVVECGVWRGGAMMLAADTLNFLEEKEKKVWLYDTFSGMTQPSEVDIDSNGRSALSEMSKKTRANNFVDWCFADIKDVTQNMQNTSFPMERVRIVKGNVLTTIPANVPEKISILRLDTDWFDSTKHEIEHLFPRLQSGGILIIDDYGTWSGSKKAIDEYFSSKNIFLQRVDHTAVLYIKD